MEMISEVTLIHIVVLEVVIVLHLIGHMEPSLLGLAIMGAMEVVIMEEVMVDLVELLVLLVIGVNHRMATLAVMAHMVGV